MEQLDPWGDLLRELFRAAVANLLFLYMPLVFGMMTSGVLRWWESVGFSADGEEAQIFGGFLD